jgi:hypothetical protein
MLTTPPEMIVIFLSDALLQLALLAVSLSDSPNGCVAKIPEEINGREAYLRIAS